MKMVEEFSIDIKKILDQADNYDQTVLAIVSFSHLLCYDKNTAKFLPDSYFFIGRKMDTSSANKIRKNHQVTPDIVIQKNRQYGIVTEVKISLTKNRDHWKDDFEQLEKYDDSLTGWKTSDEEIPQSDIALLTHWKIKTGVLEYITEKISEKELEFNQNFAVIVFAIVREREEKITFEKVFGNLSDNETNQALHNVISIPLELVIAYHGGVKFYDAKPPLSYLMSILWDQVFSQYIGIRELMEFKNKKRIVFETDVNELTIKLKEQFTCNKNHDERQPEIPKKSWVKEALDKFVELKYAETKKSDPTKFIIKYQKIRNPLETFTKEVLEGKNPVSQAPAIQQTLEGFF